jgi:hypothetical protein
MLINMRKAMAAIVPICNSHVIFCQKLHKVFHVFYEGILPSFQCKKSYDWCTPMGEVAGPRLLFINLMLQRSHHDSFVVRMRWDFLRIKYSLQSVENKQVSSVRKDM